jgi:type II secretory pathway component GspD/PulD (secretin)
MSRFWISLAVVLWLGTYALGADEPQSGNRRALLAEPTPAKGTTDTDSKTRPMAEALRRVINDKDGQAKSNIVRSVLQLKNAPASQLANTITNLFIMERNAERFDAASSVTIVPNTFGNCLVVSGSTEAVETVRKLVAQLDRAAAMVRVEVVMGDVPMAKTEAAAPVAETGDRANSAKIRVSVAGVDEMRKQMEVLFQAQLTTLENQPSYLQVGRREPTIASVNVTSMGKTTSVTEHNVGTILKLEPRVNADRQVTMTVDIEDSRLAPAGEGVPIFTPDKGEVVRAAIVDVTTLKTTIQVRNGQTVALCGMARQPKNGKQRIILVTSHILPMGGEAKHAK